MIKERTTFEQLNLIEPSFAGGCLASCGKYIVTSSGEDLHVSAGDVAFKLEGVTVSVFLILRILI
jgi:hypothetical protein